MQHAVIRLQVMPQTLLIKYHIKVVVSFQFCGPKVLFITSYRSTRHTPNFTEKISNQKYHKASVLWACHMVNHSLYVHKKFIRLTNKISHQSGNKSSVLPKILFITPYRSARGTPTLLIRYHIKVTLIVLFCGPVIRPITLNSSTSSTLDFTNKISNQSGNKSPIIWAFNIVKHFWQAHHKISHQSGTNLS